MPHEIFEERFVAVREPAWHRLGVVYRTPVLPSRAVKDADLDLGAETLPLKVATQDGRFLDTGLISVGRFENEKWLSYGVASQFEVVPLGNLLSQLDEIAGQFPLSAAGTLAKGGEVFFTFTMGREEIVGESYDSYLVFRHSYTPGVAQLVMWTPVRVVCRNTLVFGEDDASFRLTVVHTARAEKATWAALALARAFHQAQVFKQKLEIMAETKVSHDDAKAAIGRVYQPYFPRRANQILSTVKIEGLNPDNFELVVKPIEARVRYADRLIETALAAYDRFNDEFPELSHTAYGLYQAVVETADFRKGRSSSMAESAVVGARAAEKARAWNLLAPSLN